MLFLCICLVSGTGVSTVHVNCPHFKDGETEVWVTCPRPYLVCDRARIQNEDYLAPKLKFFRTVHTAIFIRALTKKTLPKLIFHYKLQVYSNIPLTNVVWIPILCREHAKSMNQDYLEQSGSCNGDGIRSSQINRTYAWVVQPDMEITKRHLENKEKSKKKQVCFCVFLFGTKTGNIIRELKGMENKLHKKPNDLDRW